MMHERGIRIGLTGDVGSGKSSLRRWLAARGAATLDADAVAHEVLGRLEQVEAVEALFGRRVIAADGRVDRAALADLVFADPEALARLEAILHPPILAFTDAWLSSQRAPVLVVEAVKLVETELRDQVDRIWLVVCAPEERRRRLRQRSWSEQEIERRMRAAPDFGRRLAAADTVIDNSASWQHTTSQLGLAWQGLGIPGAS